MASSSSSNASLKELNDLGSFEYKSILKLIYITPGETIRIVKIRKVTSQFGPRILVETEKNVLFLPKRATETVKAILDYFNSGKYGLLVTG